MHTRDTITLPTLLYEGNEQKKMTLHLLLQIIGKIRLEKTARKNHWWYATQYIETRGFSTGPIPYQSGAATFSITLNILSHHLEVETSRGEKEGFPLVPNTTVAEFYAKLITCLDTLNISIDIVDTPYDLGIDKTFSQIKEYHHYNPTYVKELWQILIWIDSVFKEFSGRFYGKTSPVHLYWHSMDLAVTRFSGNEAPPMAPDARISDKDAYTHECISFGFWAGDKNIPEPAFYSYTYPSPDSLEKEALKPDAAAWIDSNGSPMALLKYKDVLNTVNPRKALLQFLESAYQAGAKKANWDVEKFNVPKLDDM